MKLNEGNIFEAMRLVLPEHRAVMRFVSRQNSKRTRPVLTQDQLDEMQYTVSEALDQGSRVSISLYHPYEDIVLQGALIANGRTLLIDCGDEVVEVNLGNIIRIELI